MCYKTKLLDNSQSSIEIAAEFLKKGEVVGIPTETVYGLAANAFDENAVNKILKQKEDHQTTPL